MLSGLCTKLACKKNHAEKWHLTKESANAERNALLSVYSEKLLSEKQSQSANLTHTVKPHARNQAAPSVNAPNQSSPPFFTVPANNRRLVATPDKKKRLFLSQLEKLLKELDNLPPAHFIQGHMHDNLDFVLEPYVATKETKALMGGACRTCQGNCCTTANDQAFLDLASLTDITTEYAHLSSTALVSLYSENIPETHIEDSCVFHGKKGCTLPNSLRSHTCNRYMCNELMMLKHISENADVDTALVAACGESAVYRISVFSHFDYQLLSDERITFEQLKRNR